MTSDYLGDVFCISFLERRKTMYAHENDQSLLTMINTRERQQAALPIDNSAMTLVKLLTVIYLYYISAHVVWSTNDRIYNGRALGRMT